MLSPVRVRVASPQAFAFTRSSYFSKKAQPVMLAAPTFPTLLSLDHDLLPPAVIVCSAVNHLAVVPIIGPMVPSPVVPTIIPVVIIVINWTGDDHLLRRRCDHNGRSALVHGRGCIDH